MKSRLKFSTVIVLTSLQMLIITGCADLNNGCLRPAETSNHMEDLTSDEPAILATRNPEQIREAAIADARTDIAARRLRIAFTGGIVSWPTGVPEKCFKTVASYPRVHLPSGCTSSWLTEATIYAEAYNQEMLPALIEDQNSWKHAKLSL